SSETSSRRSRWHGAADTLPGGEAQQRRAFVSNGGADDSHPGGGLLGVPSEIRQRFRLFEDRPREGVTHPFVLGHGGTLLVRTQQRTIDRPGAQLRVTEGIADPVG